MRASPINLRVMPEQRDLIDQAANMLGKSRTDFVMEAACERAQSVLLDQVFFSLETSDFKHFMSMLDAPQHSNAGLDRLMDVVTPWKRNP